MKKNCLTLTTINIDCWRVYINFQTAFHESNNTAWCDLLVNNDVERNDVVNKTKVKRFVYQFILKKREFVDMKNSAIQSTGRTKTFLLLLLALFSLSCVSVLCFSIVCVAICMWHENIHVELGKLFTLLTWKYLHKCQQQYSKIFNFWHEWKNYF